MSTVECFLQRPRTGSRCGQGGKTEYGADSGLTTRPAMSSDRRADLFLAFARDLLDEVDDAAPKLCLFDPHEGFGQRKPFGGGEEVRDIGRRGRLFHSLRRPMQVGRAFE